jgi:small subunit ribosomal protein S1
MTAESFSKLLEESLSNKQLRPGAIVTGKVVQINPNFVIVNAGLKSEGVIPVEQFYNEQGELEVAVGDDVEVTLEALEDGFGETKLSREKAKRTEAWAQLDRAHKSGTSIKGFVSGKVKGGFTVELGIIRGFLPGSLVDIRPVRDTSYIEGKELEFKVIKLDPKRNNIVLSRRAVIESEGSAEREALLNNIEEGQVIKGVVKNLTDYGAFVDLGGIDGLLHVTDMSWKRVRHPNEVVAIGDELKVVVLKFDRDRGRVSLGLKQLADDPWSNIVRRYPIGARLFGKITNVTDYGCFVEVEAGVEGLVHVSEMDWTNKNVSPNKIVQVGDEVEVMVLDVDTDRRRISLGLKQCKRNPWEAFGAVHNKGEKITGKIKSLTDFGLFIGLDGGIDGLIHMSDISWNVPGEEAVRNYKKGDEVTAVILSIDPERERISLGIKQMEQDNQATFLSEHPKGSLVKGNVQEIEEKGVKIELGEGIEGYLKLSELQSEGKEVKVGQSIEAAVVGIDRKTRHINLSLKAKETQSQETE